MREVVMNAVNEFRDALLSGLEGIMRAAEVYVAAVDEDPRNADVFRDELSDFVPASAWAMFEAVGRRQMHPKLLMGGMADRKKSAAVKRLPYSQQERVFAGERVELVVESGDLLKVSLLDCTADQAEQICSRAGFRSQSQQRAWLEEKRLAAARKALAGGAGVVPGKVEPLVGKGRL